MATVFDGVAKALGYKETCRMDQAEIIEAAKARCLKMLNNLDMCDDVNIHTYRIGDNDFANSIEIKTDNFKLYAVVWPENTNE